jgi:hypothetical protein
MERIPRAVYTIEGASTALMNTGSCLTSSI